LLVALTCLGIGAGASAIATASASSTHAKTAHRNRHGILAPRAIGLLRRTVQGSFVVATKSGFVNVTVARGQVQSVSGQTITIVEGTPKQTYKTVALTLPSTVTVRDDRQPATLGQVTAGQRATVIVGPNQALVVAHTPKSS
jgi:hypothetical protein